MKGKLTPRQRKFVNAYLLSGNATKSAIKAGYSKKTAQVIGAENLSKPMIKEALSAGQADAQKEFTITREEVIRDLKRMLDFDPRKLFNSDGNAHPIVDLDSNTAWCLSQFEDNTSTVDSKDGHGTILHNVSKRKWESKIAALKQVCEMCGYNAPIEIGKDTLIAWARLKDGISDVK